MEKKIRLRRFDEVRDFVCAADHCEHNVDVSYNRMVIDARSLIGVLSMDLTQVLTVKYDEEDVSFANLLDKYKEA